MSCASPSWLPTQVQNKFTPPHFCPINQPGQGGEEGGNMLANSRGQLDGTMEYMFSDIFKLILVPASIFNVASTIPMPLGYTSC